uniref:DNA-directed DNA polymerase n=1 Tax=Sporolithon durum TaxID=48970 RepID=A0A141SD44_9FLOR|nr:hypothetical protein Sdur_174 [Sporolithon durum]AMK96212.1 hypothetical protein Sdur_174 [Sporolithon durum]
MKSFVSSGLFLNSKFAILDYLYQYNTFIREIPYDNNNCNYLYIDIIGFFLIADLLRLFQQDWFEEILAIIENSNPQTGVISHDKRLRMYTKKTRKEQPYIFLKRTVLINDKRFNIAIGCIDNLSLQGKISYKELCNNTDVPVEYKETYTKAEKKYMLEQYLTNSDKFEKYALGDLYNYSALINNHYLYSKLYKILGLEEFINFPKPTIGASVFKLYEAALLKSLNIKNSNQLKEVLKYSCHEFFIQNLQSTQVYLAKTNGGRCYNNRPLDHSIKGPIVDIDIKGCYGNGLRLQEYAIGRPIIIEYPINSKINRYLNLREFLKKYESELVKGLWIARISTSKNLSFDQDFFYSWYPPKKLSSILLTDSFFEGDDEILENDHSKIYSRQIHLGILEHEGLNWIYTACNKKNREELLDKLNVITAAYYPKSKRVKTAKEFFHKLESHKGRNYCYVKKSEKIVRIQEECHYWTSLNIGEIIVNNLLKEREKYSKKVSNERSMNNFIKLNINTIYGDLVSPFFYIGNTIVGNNITARARAAVWYLEKALHGFQTITDGCCFELNRVIDSKYKLKNHKIMDIEKSRKKRHISIKPLLGNNISNNDVRIQKKDKEFYHEIEIEVINHIRIMFPHASIWNKFELEIKEIASKLITHGASNYMTIDGINTSNVKMRSYRDTLYEKYTFQSNKIIRVGEWKPIYQLFHDIDHNGENLTRQFPFVHSTIIKTKNYCSMKSQLKENMIYPGNTYHIVRLIPEFTISRFLFQTKEQYDCWHKECITLKRKYLQSYEAVYLTKDENINYYNMMIEISKKIKDGAKLLFNNNM